jgi:divalent metal cation (Fe/Co/Zn/Cd) transporter
MNENIESPSPEPRSRLSLEEDPRSRSAIVSDLWQNTEHLLGQELDLLRAELDQRTRMARNDLVEFSLAGAVAYTGALAFVAAVILLLAKRLDPWLAAMIVGLSALAVGYGMFRHSVKKLSQRDMVPRKAVESVETTAHTIKEALR